MALSCTETMAIPYFRKIFLLQRDVPLRLLSSMATSTVSKEFFEQKYRGNCDPWSFSSSTYEQNRYDEIVRLLGSRTFRRRFEPGCWIGVLTERLAGCCRNLFAMDISRTAVGLAQKRCSHFSNVTVVGALPGDLPDGTFDLIVSSEIGYYFDRGVLGDLRDRLTERLQQRGLLVNVDWLGVSRDHLLSGDEVHEVLRSNNDLKVKASRRYYGFLVESWERP